MNMEERFFAMMEDVAVSMERDMPILKNQTLTDLCKLVLESNLRVGGDNINSKRIRAKTDCSKEEAEEYLKARDYICKVVSSRDDIINEWYREMKKEVSKELFPNL